MNDEATAETRLATYGTLSPGRSNAHQLAGLDGEWTRGVVRGCLATRGWGPDRGYPAIVLDQAAGDVPVHVFTSNDLPAHWPRLDAFEGRGYQRSPVPVVTDAGTVWASIYTLADD